MRHLLEKIEGFAVAAAGKPPGLLILAAVSVTVTVRDVEVEVDEEDRFAKCIGELKRFRVGILPNEVFPLPLAILCLYLIGGVAESVRAAGALSRSFSLDDVRDMGSYSRRAIVASNEDVSFELCRLFGKIGGCSVLRNSGEQELPLRWTLR